MKMKKFYSNFKFNTINLKPNLKNLKIINKVMQ